MTKEPSFAVEALLTIQLEQADGTGWVRVTDLANHLALPVHVVCEHLSAMAARLEVALIHDGMSIKDARLVEKEPQCE